MPREKGMPSEQKEPDEAGAKADKTEDEEEDLLVLLPAVLVLPVVRVLLLFPIGTDNISKSQRIFLIEKRKRRRTNLRLQSHLKEKMKDRYCETKTNLK